MTSEGWQVGLSILGSGGLVALLNALVTKRKVTAEATEIIANAAGQMTDRLERQVKALQDRLDRFEYDEQRRSVMLDVHVEWDRSMVREWRKAVPDRVFPDPPPLHLPVHLYRADYDPPQKGTD